jgi:hypothetical protein
MGLPNCDLIVSNVDHLVHFVDVGRQERACGADAGVVDEKADAGVSPKNRLDLRQPVTGKIRRDHLDPAAGLARKALG